MAELHDLYVFALKIKGISFEDCGRRQLRRKLTGKARFPEGFDILGLDLVLNRRNDARSGDGPCIRKTVEQRFEAEKVVAVAMGDIDDREVPAARGHPIQELS